MTHEPIVPTATKVAIYDEIVNDDGEGLLPGWDGTFRDLHRFVDANEYIADVFAGYGERACDACNEVCEWLDRAFAVARDGSLRFSS